MAADSKPETTHNFCNTEWLQQKCQYDCRDMPELCNPWVLVQCGKCNFAANNTHQPTVNKKLHTMFAIQHGSNKNVSMIVKISLSFAPPGYRANVKYAIFRHNRSKWCC